MAEEQPRKHNMDVNVVLRRILEEYPQIGPSSIELFSDVYYPIAILEMELTETTFEDFDLVPLTVLKFMSAGVLSADEIAGIMGLSKNYVQKIIDLLMGYGYIDASGLTSVGKESLKQEKKITRYTVKQRFHADAITGDLLKLGEQPSEADMEGKDTTYWRIPYIPHLEGISEEVINKQLQTDLTRYKRYQGSVLNANTDEIKDIICVGLEYTRAYLVKLQGIKSPFIFSNQYDPTKIKYSERFKWQPMRMPDEKAYSEYGFSREIECYTPEALKTINELYKLVCKSIAEADIMKSLKHIHDFNFTTMDVSVENFSNGVPEQVSVYLNADSFTQWNGFVRKFLENYDPVVGYVYTNSSLNGLFIRFESQSADIKTASKRYKKLIRHTEDKGNLNTYINNYFTRMQEEKVFDFKELLKALEQYEAEKEEL